MMFSSLVDRYMLPGEDRYDNSAQARAVIRAWDRFKGFYPDGVQIWCLDQSEADEIKAEINRLRPDVKVYVRYQK